MSGAEDGDFTRDFITCDGCGVPLEWGRSERHEDLCPFRDAYTRAPGPPPPGPPHFDIEMARLRCAVQRLYPEVPLPSNAVALSVAATALELREAGPPPGGSRDTVSRRGTRDEAIARYEAWLDEQAQIQFVAELNTDHDHDHCAGCGDEIEGRLFVVLRLVGVWHLECAERHLHEALRAGPPVLVERLAHG